MGRLRRADALLQRAERGLLVGLLSAMIVLSFAQVVLRQGFGTGLLWADTLLRHLVLWVGFLGAALAAADNKHFAWEAASYAGPRAGAWLHLAARLAGTAICLALARASWIFLKDEFLSEAHLFTVAGVAVPAWLFSLIIPLGFVLVAFHTAVQAAEAGLTLRKR